MPMGRPSDYNPVVADQICELIVQGFTIREIDALPTMPGKTAIFSWLLRHPDFAERYARAREFRADDMADELLEISDDATNDWMERRAKSGEIESVPDNEAVQRSRLRVDTRKWLMGKLKPKKYGDKIQHEHNLNADPQAVPYSELQAIAKGRTLALTIEHDAAPSPDGSPEAPDE
jgi:hypothetical protein